MSTRQRKFLPGKKSSPVTVATVLVDTRQADADAARFLYALIAALGLAPVDPHDADQTSCAVNLQVVDNSILTDNQQWRYPEQTANIEAWLVSTCFPPVDDATVWAVVQTGAERIDMLAAAMAHAHRDDGVLLLDADASETLSHSVLEATDNAFEVLLFDFDVPSPHIYVLNAPSWEGVTMLLQVDRANPLNTGLLPDILEAAKYHFSHTVIDCGTDLFLAQRLAAAGSRVIHVDDCTRPLYVDLTPYKRLDCSGHDIPRRALGQDLEHVVQSRRGHASMRRWMKRGDAV